MKRPGDLLPKPTNNKNQMEEKPEDHSNHPKEDLKANITDSYVGEVGTVTVPVPAF